MSNVCVWCRKARSHHEGDDPHCALRLEIAGALYSLTILKFAYRYPENRVMWIRVVTHRQSRGQWDDVRKKPTPLAVKAAESQ